MACCLNCLNVDDLCCCGDCEVSSVCELCKCCISKYCITLRAVPVLVVTGLAASRLYCLNVDDLCCVRNCEVLSVGESEVLIVYRIALGAVVVCCTTVLVASSFNCLNVDDICCCRYDYVLEVSELCESLILPCCLAIRAVPVLDVTVLAASRLNCLVVLEVLGTESGNYYVLDVCKLCKSLVSPYLLTLVADPVLDVTVPVATCFDCIDMHEEVASCSGKNYVLDVCKLCKSFVSPYLLTVVAYPVLDVTCVVATGLYCLEVNEVVRTCSGYDYVLGVGDLSKCFILPVGLAVCAVPEFDVTIVVATSLNCLKVNNIMLSCREDYVFDVCELSESLVLPYLLAGFAVPVLNVTFSVACRSYCLNVNYFAADCRNYYVLDVCELCKSLVSPYLLAVVAYPVLDVTIVVASGLYCVKVNYFTANSGKNYVLDVCKLCKSFILPYLLTVVAYPVLDVTIVVASGLYCIKVYKVLGTCSGDYNVKSVCELSKSCISKYCITLRAVPVLSVTCVVATCLNCLNVDDLSSCESYEILSVSNDSAFCICIYGIATIAVPVLLHTVLVACSLNSRNVLERAYVEYCYSTVVYAEFNVFACSIDCVLCYELSVDIIVTADCCIKYESECCAVVNNVSDLCVLNVDCDYAVSYAVGVLINLEEAGLDGVKSKSCVILYSDAHSPYAGVAYEINSNLSLLALVNLNPRIELNSNGRNVAVHSVSEPSAICVSIYSTAVFAVPVFLPAVFSSSRSNVGRMCKSALSEYTTVDCNEINVFSCSIDRVLSYELKVDIGVTAGDSFKCNYECIAVALNVIKVSRLKVYCNNAVSYAVAVFISYKEHITKC